MQVSEFNLQVVRLRNTYGERSYPEERCKMLWHAFQKIPDGIFEKVCNDLIGQMRQAPMLNDFSEYLSRLASVSRPVHNILKLNCPACNSQGYFEMLNPETGNRTTASCAKCATGAELRNRDHHPICSEEIARRHGYTEKNLILALKNAVPFDEQPAERLSPWPLSIEGLMVLVRDQAPTSEIESLARAIKLSDEKVWHLWDHFQAKRFDDPKALEIVNSVRQFAAQCLNRALRRPE